MYDELVKLLRCQQYGNCPECVNWYAEEVEPNQWRASCMAIDAADVIEELNRENKSLAKSVNEASEILRKRWIPVEKRLPEENGDYIVYCIGGNYNQTSCIRLAYWSGKHFYGDNLLSVTNWMNLPDPPKGDE